MANRTDRNQDMPLKNRRPLCGVLAASLCALVFHSAHEAIAQRVQFGTMVTPDSPFYTPPTAQPALPPGPLTPPGAPAAQAWDPFADPTAAPAEVYPQGGYIQSNGQVARPQQLVHEIRGEHAWLAGSSKGSELGMQEIFLRASFAFPFLWNPEPLLITPGFNFHFFNGPTTGDVFGNPDLPPVVYDAYLESAWAPKINNWLSADLTVAVGVYSDFDKVNKDSVLVTGEGLGVLTFSPRMKLALGVAYLARQNVKLLPAGGVIYNPSPDTKVEAIFPHPKVSHRFTTVGNTDVWWYLIGRFGGGRWTIARIGDINDRVTYNDVRLGGGLEFVGFRGTTGWIDVSYVFERHVLYQTNTSNFNADPTVAITSGISF